jgi:RNA-splicing ligase RtcB
MADETSVVAPIFDCLEESILSKKLLFSSVEEYASNGETMRLFVHRKGASRAFGPGQPRHSGGTASVGRPVLIGGTMGTASYILAGRPKACSWRSAPLVTALGVP